MLDEKALLRAHLLHSGTLDAVPLMTPSNTRIYWFEAEPDYALLLVYCPDCGYSNWLGTCFADEADTLNAAGFDVQLLDVPLPANLRYLFELRKEYDRSELQDAILAGSDALIAEIDRALSVPQT